MKLEKIAKLAGMTILAGAMIGCSKLSEAPFEGFDVRYSNPEHPNSGVYTTATRTFYLFDPKTKERKQVRVETLKLAEPKTRKEIEFSKYRSGFYHVNSFE